MNVSQQELRKKSAFTGILLGVVLVVLSVISFYFITTIATSFWMISFGPIIFSVLIPLAVAALFCSDLRKKVGGYWTFKQAVTGIFIMFFVAYVVNYIGYNLLFTKVVEPHAVEKTRDKIVGASTSMMEKQGLDQDKIDEQTEKMNQQFDLQNNLTVGKVITGIAISLIFMFVIALIFAAIFKKDPPFILTNPDDELVDPVV